MTTTFTEHFRFGVPDFLSTPWHQTVQDTLHQVDKALYQTLLAADAEPWENSTIYAQGDIVLDTVNGIVYIARVSHTSAATPTTFDQDRIANPTFWAEFSIITLDLSANNRFLGRVSGGPGPVEELSGTQATSLLDTFTNTLKGVAPPSGGGAVNFLRADGSWTVPPGLGDVVGPSPATSNAVTRFDGPSGKLLKNSSMTVDDNGLVAINALGTSNIALTINLPNTFAHGVGQQHNVVGPIGLLDYFINYHIVSDTADAGANAIAGIYGQYIKYIVGGSTVKGARSALTAEMILDGPTNTVGNPNRFYLGAFITSAAATGDGGGLGTELGYIGGLNVGALATSALAQNLESLVGIEVNVNMVTGSSTRSRLGVAIGPNLSGGFGQGSFVDSGLYFFNNNGSGWVDGIMFDSVVGAPIDPAGKILSTRGSFPIGTAIDFSSLHVLGVSTIADYIIRGPDDNFTVTGTGEVRPKRLTDTVVSLTDGPSVTIDASLGGTFKLAAFGNRTVLAPTNSPITGKSHRLVIAHEASGANRTLALSTGAAGSFRFGTDITGLTVTLNGTIDYIGCLWNQADDRWDVVSYVKGF